MHYGAVMEGREAVEEAARFVVNAASGKEDVKPKATALARRAFRLSKRLGLVVQDGVIPVIFFLSFVERPRWCTELEACTCKWRVDRDCVHPTFDVPYLSTKAKVTVELGALVVAATHQLLLKLASETYWPEYRSQCVAVTFAIVANLFLLLQNLLQNLQQQHQEEEETLAFFLAAYARLVVFVSYSADVRSQLRLAGHILPHFLRVGSLIALLTLFYAWFGVVLFSSTEEGALSFANFREAAWHLMILITTANFPDVALPAFVRNRWSMLFFASYVLVGCFFFMNLLLATVYNVYTEERAKQEARVQKRAKDQLDAAFDVLTGYGRRDDVDVAAVRDLFDELNRHHEVSYIDSDRARFLVGELDQSADNRIDRDEFAELGAVLRLKDSRTRRKRPDDEERLAAFVESRAFEYGVDALLVANAGVIAWQTRNALLYGSESAESSESSSSSSSESSSESSIYVEALEATFALLYLGEMGLKVWALGGAGYWREFRNRFDGAVTVASICAVAVVYYPNAIRDAAIVRYVLMVRLLRLVRLLAAVPDFRVIGESFLRMLPAASRLLKLLFVLTSAFAVLGMQLFGGEIRDGDPRLEKTAFYEDGYLPLNFNDMLSAYTTLFSILVVNNWFVIAEGFVAVTGLGARLYFLAFYAAGVLVCVNISTAFILDSFIAELEKTRHERHQMQQERRNVLVRQFSADTTTETTRSGGVGAGK